MGTTNYGGQIITYGYGLPATGEDFSRILHKIVEPGLYFWEDKASGTMPLTKVDNGTVSVSPMVFVIEDGTTGVSVRVETTLTENINIDATAPFIVWTYAWSNSSNWYADLVTKAYGAIEATDVVVGRAVYSGSSLMTSFDYSRTTFPSRIAVERTMNPIGGLKVSPQTPIGSGVVVQAGYLRTKGGNVAVTQQTVSLSSVPPNRSRVDLVWIDSAGNVQIVDGEDVAAGTTPSVPMYDYRFVVAEVHRTAGSSTLNVVRGNDIVDARNANRLDISNLHSEFDQYQVKLSSQSSGLGASLIGVEDAGSKFPSVSDVEGALQASVSSLTEFTPYTPLATGDDLDQINMSGIFVNNNPANATFTLNYPEKNVGGILLSFAGNDRLFWAQIFWADSGNMYMRSMPDFNSGVWQPWSRTHSDIASRWEIPRTLQLSGDVEGSVDIDGSGDVTLTTSFASGAVDNTISDGIVSQAKLKTSSASFSHSYTVGTGGDAGAIFSSPAGSYGFWPTIDNLSDYGSVSVLLYQNYTGDTGTVISVDLHGATSGSSSSITVSQRYITSSGEVFWVFLLRDRDSGGIISVYAAPDHPSFGTSNPEALVENPFPKYDPVKGAIMYKDEAGENVFRPADIEVINPLKAQYNEIKQIAETKGISIAQVIQNDFQVEEIRTPLYPDELGEPDYIPVDITVGIKGEEFPFESEAEIIKKRIQKPEYIKVKKLRRVV